MRDNIQIQNRIRELLSEQFEQRAQAAEEKLPRCCVYNYRHPLDSRRRVDGEANPHYNRITRGDPQNGLPVVQTIGLCMYGSEDPETWGGTICEDPIDAQRCPLFKAKVTREALAAEFEAQIRDLEWVKTNMPEVHALLWALDEDKERPSTALAPVPPSTTEESPPPMAATEELPPSPPLHMSAWRRFLLWLAGLGMGHRRLPPGDS